MTRIVTLDTETTGLSARLGHRIIEIGAVEVMDGRITGRQFHTYLQPGRAVDPGARRVHGISDDMLVGKPAFADRAGELLDFVRGSEVVIHNAPFDTGFLDHELHLWNGRSRLADICRVTCSLKLARARFPGMPNKLDDLLRRLGIPAQRDLHGALLDAQLLAHVLLAMR
ncbi:DNA polymerase III subunit epsilon [Luteimonas arsenica]|uniref:DNA polymerase III subunit epsilon n=1 Tax=Luteimonas arsenica TaxID=1586242 RepID=UPI0010547094|nr:DNA polymerase III subunit epsilon [Luteimonas arsenica]